MSIRDSLFCTIASLAMIHMGLWLFTTHLYIAKGLHVPPLCVPLGISFNERNTAICISVCILGNMFMVIQRKQIHAEQAC